MSNMFRRKTHSLPSCFAFTLIRSLCCVGLPFSLYLVITYSYPDTLLIASKLSEPLQSGADRFTLHAAAYSLNSWEAYQRKLEESHGDYDKVREPGPVCTADQLCVSYDYTKLAKAPLPDDLREVSVHTALPCVGIIIAFTNSL